MAIDTKLIKELREKTGMGITNCKKALEEADGDCGRAEMILRKQGLDKAAKKADRPTGQGVVAVKVDGDRAAMIELACEQEPTTNNGRFLALVALALDAALSENVSNVDQLNGAKSGDGVIADSVKELIGVVGENVQLRKAITIAAPVGGVIGSYVHFNKKAGAIVALKLDGVGKDGDGIKIAANDICLHAVAARPLAWRRDDIPPDILAKEKEVFMEEIKNKPEQIRDKILNGKIEKFYADKVLPEQLFVKGLEGTVKEMLDAAAKAAGGKAEIAAFARFELGL
ncbi:MAG: translation elongation factor Ts [Planctomycetota bacterium]|jgi:elongation factor Ts|nr:translation elongation factor Ts [Planctomycetota bacterium]